MFPSSAIKAMSNFVLSKYANKLIKYQITNFFSWIAEVD